MRWIGPGCGRGRGGVVVVREVVVLVLALDGLHDGASTVRGVG